MRLNIQVEVGLEHLIWATWFQVYRGRNPTKGKTLEFLRNQIAAYGCDLEILMGAHNAEAMAGSAKDVERAEAYVAKWWPKVEALYE